MKLKNLFPLLFIVALTSCVTKAPALYNWGNYSDATYNYIKSRTDADKDKLIAAYEKIIAKQTCVRKCVPPGLYADYGYLLIQNNEVAKGQEMLQKEIELYPESKVFIERILTSIKK